jgi:Subtilase family/Proprotein convertase P-domain
MASNAIFGMSAAALVLLCGAASGAQFGAEGSAKVRVPASDAPAALARQGATLVASYDSFVIVELPAAQARALVAAAPAADLLEEENLVRLNAGALDTTTARIRALQQPVGEFEGKRMHLVQFAGPVQPAWHDELVRTGVEVITYIPSNSYLVYGDAAQLTRLQDWAGKTPQVQWNGAYRDEYRIDPAAGAVLKDPKRAEDAAQEFSIQLVKDQAANDATVALLTKLGGALVRDEDSLNYHNVILPMPASQLPVVAARPDVVSIQVYSTPTMADERQDIICAGMLTNNAPTAPGYLAWIQSKGFTQAQFDASGFSVDVTDSGIDNGTTTPNHFGLYSGGVRPGTSRVTYNRIVGTPGGEIRGCDGHGTENTHIVIGWDDSSGFPFADSLGYHYGLGVCPWTRAGSSAIFTPGYTTPNFVTLQSMAYHDGARISTNSWGSGAAGAYTADAQSYDALVRDAQPAGSSFPTAGNQEMVIVFAAHNFGPGASSVGSPGTGKNVLTCAAAESVAPFGGPDGCGEADTLADNANEMAPFSGRGPCTDGRKKPDLSAPGVHISGGVFQTASPGPNGTADPCFNGSLVCGGPGGSHFWPASGQQFYTASSGTSHSTPCIAGACALVRQYVLNLGMPAPSPAMTKAILMNAARFMTGLGAAESLYSNNQGMGELDLSRVFDHNVVTSAFSDEEAANVFTATGQTRQFTGTVADSSKPFRVTLAWTDAPGATSGAARKNNLDLTVSVGGNTYRGNVFTGSGSITGGSADANDNVECVFLPPGVAGPYSVTVTAADINSDGVPNSGGVMDQDFALVVYNGTSAPIVILSGTGVNTFTDNTGNGNANGRIDPGESDIRLSVQVRNNGNIPATGVTGTLTTTTPTVSLTNNASAYPDLPPGGGTAVNSTPYVLNVSPNHTCGDPIALTLNINSGQGSASYGFSLSTGLAGGGGPFTESYTGPVVPIPDAPNTTGATAVLNVSGYSGTIGDLNFRFDGATCSNAAGATGVGLNHTWVGDLIITLTSPQGTSVTIMNHPGGTNNQGNNFCQTVLDDGASATIHSITSAGAPWSGSFQPDSPLSVFNGQSPNGAWQLHAVDSFQGETGSIRRFSLILNTIGIPACDPPRQTCGSADFDCDGDVGTDADIQSFFACIGGHCPAPPCTSSADFNGDGDAGTDADIEAFFRVLGGGHC